MEAALGIRNFGSTEDDTCAGNADKQVLAASAVAKERRSGVMIKNHSDPLVANLTLWVKAAPRLSKTTSTIAITSTSMNEAIPAGAALYLGYSDSLDVFIRNSSGAATTCAYTAQNYSY